MATRADLHDTTCRNCGIGIGLDDENVWRHDGHDGETCGEASPDAYAEPQAEQGIIILTSR